MRLHTVMKIYVCVCVNSIKKLLFIFVKHTYKAIHIGKNKKKTSFLFMYVCMCSFNKKLSFISITIQTSLYASQKKIYIYSSKYALCAALCIILQKRKIIFIKWTHTQTYTHTQTCSLLLFYELFPPNVDLLMV